MLSIRFRPVVNIQVLNDMSLQCLHHHGCNPNACLSAFVILESIINAAHTANSIWGHFHDRNQTTSHKNNRNINEKKYTVCSQSR